MKRLITILILCITTITMQAQTTDKCSVVTVTAVTM